MTGYKIFDLRNGKPLFLFHGLNGSRIVPVGKWITAERKDATDGSNATVYTSGFHIFPDESEVYDWLKWVKNVDNRVVVKVEMRNTRPKSHGRGNVVLADHMIITPQQWRRRTKLSEYR